MGEALFDCYMRKLTDERIIKYKELGVLKIVEDIEDKLKENIFTYSLIAALVNIGVYIFSEVFIEIGKNPYSMSLKGILMNAYIFFLPIVAKEYTRFRVINNVYEKDKKYIAVVATII